LFPDSSQRTENKNRIFSFTHKNQLLGFIFFIASTTAIITIGVVEIQIGNGIETFARDCLDLFPLW